MYKVIHLVKRKSHLTHEQFRDHFERSHAAMAMKFCGHLFPGYRRNYVKTASFGGDSRLGDPGYGPKEWHWDLISEWMLPDEAAYIEVLRIMQLPDIGKLFQDDEDRIMDRRSIVDAHVTVYDSGTVFDPKGTVFDTPTGEPSWD
jgi:hypothetical protein